MVAIPLPDCDIATVKKRLYDEFHVEVPLTTVNDKPHVRVSFQAYNSASDAQALIDGLHAILD
jgi:isopenicillin-N epimerase